MTTSQPREQVLSNIAAALHSGWLQTFEAVPSVPMSYGQQLGLRSILTVPYQLSRGSNPSRLLRAPNLQGVD